MRGESQPIFIASPETSVGPFWRGGGVDPAGGNCADTLDRIGAYVPQAAEARL
jgi:hypothetical protein